MAKKNDLDVEYPQGNPAARLCRWCSRLREWRPGTEKNSALICPHCDAWQAQP